jgi:hypothetical protein
MVGSSMIDIKLIIRSVARIPKQKNPTPPKPLKF